MKRVAIFGELGSLANVIAAAIQFALDRHHGDVSKAARELRVSRSTIYRNTHVVPE